MTHHRRRLHIGWKLLIGFGTPVLLVLAGIITLMIMQVYLSRDIVMDRAVSPDGHRAVARVTDCGPSWEWGADFDLAVSILDSSGRQIATWDGGSQNDREWALVAARSLSWEEAAGAFWLETAMFDSVHLLVTDPPTPYWGILTVMIVHEPSTAALDLLKIWGPCSRWNLPTTVHWRPRHEF